MRWRDEVVFGVVADLSKRFQGTLKVGAGLGLVPLCLAGVVRLLHLNIRHVAWQGFGK